MNFDSSVEEAIIHGLDTEFSSGADSDSIKQKFNTFQVFFISC